MANTNALIDPRLVERTENLRLALGTIEKDDRNPLFIEDKPWEVRFDNLYANVVWSAEKSLFECWYNPFIICSATTNTSAEDKLRLPYKTAEREMGLCYATSRDGLAWDKPSLNLIEFEGSKQNNLVMRDIHGVGVSFDAHDPDDSRRYKAFTSVGTGTSPDGLHWTLRACPDIGAIGDTHNNVFWDTRTQQYIGFTRLWQDGQRIVARTTSRDFQTWTEAEEVLRASPDALDRQVYELLVFPYSTGYLGIAAILDKETDCVDCELAWSADTVTWQRVCEGSPLIPRGNEGAWDWGCMYAAAYPVVSKNEILLYYGGGNDTHHGWRKTGLGLARLRPDGFAGWEPASGKTTGELVTASLRCTAPNLTITCDAAGGAIRAEILDADGFSLDTCRPVVEDVTNAPITWESGKTLERFVGKNVQVRFEMKAAKLFSIGFEG
jgi:hypothetical protein